MLQEIWFFKKGTDFLDVSKEDYTRSTIAVDSNLSATYATNKATDVIIDIKSGRNVVMNTGFLKEEYTETIQQLMLSENVWIVEGSNTYPVIPTSKQLNYKTNLNDKLINFTVDFRYAFNESNINR